VRVRHCQTAQLRSPMDDLVPFQHAYPNIQEKLSYPQPSPLLARDSTGLNPQLLHKSPSIHQSLRPCTRKPAKNSRRTPTTDFCQYGQDASVALNTGHVSSAPILAPELPVIARHGVRHRRVPTTSKARRQKSHSTRDESGCLTCRIRKKKCPIGTVDGNMYCQPCRDLNIECLGHYGEGYPPGLKNQEIKDACIAKIKQHTKRPASRSGPELSLFEFCGAVPRPNVSTPDIKTHVTTSAAVSQPLEVPSSQNTFQVPKEPLPPTSTCFDSAFVSLSVGSGDASPAHSPASHSLVSGRFNQSTLDFVEPTAEAAWSACDQHSAEAANLGTQLEVTIDSSFAFQLNNLPFAVTLASYSNAISFGAESVPHLTARGFD